MRGQLEKAKRGLRDERGALMLDGMIAMTVTILMLVFLMSFGFLLYQQWMVSNIANDTATRIAQSYAYPNTDPVIGYVNVEIMDNVPLFRYMGDNLEAENRDKGEKYAAWALGLSSLAYPVSDPEIKVDVEADSLARRHVEVTVRAEYEIPFGGALQYFGLDKTVTYEATGYGVCMDILDYINTVDTVKSLSEDNHGSKFLGAANSFLGMIDKLKELFFE